MNHLSFNSTGTEWGAGPGRLFGENPFFRPWMKDQSVLFRFWGGSRTTSPISAVSICQPTLKWDQFPHLQNVSSVYLPLHEIHRQHYPPRKKHPEIFTNMYTYIHGSHSNIYIYAYVYMTHVCHDFVLQVFFLTKFRTLKSSGLASPSCSSPSSHWAWIFLRSLGKYRGRVFTVFCFSSITKQSRFELFCDVILKKKKRDSIPWRFRSKAKRMCRWKLQVEHECFKGWLFEEKFGWPWRHGAIRAILTLKLYISIETYKQK